MTSPSILRQRLLDLTSRVHELGRSGSALAEVLLELQQDDVLGLGDRSAARIRDEALLLDSAKLAFRAMAWTVYHASKYTEDQEPGAWLEERVDAAVRSVIDQDAAALRGHEEEPPPWSEDRFWWLVQTFRIAPANALEACVRFNSRPVAERRVFLAIFRNGKSLAESAVEFDGSLERTQLALRRVLHKLGVSTGALPGDPSREGDEDG